MQKLKLEILRLHKLTDFQLMQMIRLREEVNAVKVHQERVARPRDELIQLVHQLEVGYVCAHP